MGVTDRSAPPPRLDPTDPDVLKDPYPYYRELRRASPLCRFGPRQWGITRHEDVARLLRSPQLGHAFPTEYYEYTVGDGPARAFFERISVVRDPPDHTRLRRTMGTALSERAITSLKATVNDIVERRLDDARESGGLEVVSDLAFPVPLQVMSTLLGLDTIDEKELRHKAVDLSRGWQTQVPVEDRALVDSAVEWFREYLGAQVARRRRHPGDDLLTRFITATDSDGNTLDHHEIIDNTIFLLFAGFETTKNLIATGCALLSQHPEAFTQLKNNPAIAPTAVEEFLRYDAPIQGAGRFVRQPVEIGGRTIRPGWVLVLLLGSANHDENHFTNPHRLDLTRTPNPHLSFGGGSHYCLGANLARLEATTVFTKLATTFTTLQPTSPAQRHLTPNFRSYHTIPLTVA